MITALDVWNYLAFTFLYIFVCFYYDITVHLKKQKSCVALVGKGYLKDYFLFYD